MQNAVLYELAGPGWMFPIFAKHVEASLVEVKVAQIPTLKQQRAAVEKALCEKCSHREGETWFFSRSGLDGIAFKSSRTDPEEVLVWRQPDEYWKTQPDFASAYRNSVFCVVRDKVYFTFVWASICRFMIDWLLAGKELDFGFLKLNAVCARRNWKNVVIGRLTARQRNGVSMDTEQTRRQVRKLLHQSVMTAFDEQSNTVKWTIEATPTKEFDEAARVTELKRKRQADDYPLNVLTFLKSHGHKNRMFEILMSYWKATKVRCLNLPHGSPQVKPGLTASAAPAWLQTAIVEGHCVKDKNGRVNLPDRSLAMNPGELRDLRNWLIPIAGNSVVNAVAQPVPA